MMALGVSRFQRQHHPARSGWARTTITVTMTMANVTWVMRVLLTGI
jgi:hypothetical protein